MSTLPRPARAVRAVRITATAATLAAVAAGASVLPDRRDPVPVAEPGPAPAVMLTVAAAPATADPRQAAADERAEKAAARAAAERDRARAAAEKAAAERREAARRQAARSAARDPRSIARAMLGGYGWGSGQFSCLDALWTKESNWSVTADNPSSSAYGIPQALPGSKMATAGADWRTNPVTQIRWGLGYIEDVYGTPCAAWAHSQAHNWY